jgi:hypothetical protein
MGTERSKNDLSVPNKESGTNTYTLTGTTLYDPNASVS